jgi:hypothetical protein
VVGLARARINARLYRSLRLFSAGRAPDDGEPTAVAGVIRAKKPLLTPLSRRPAAYFSYSVYRRVGKASREEYYCGEALTPSEIVTPQGEFRLLAIPHVEFGIATDPATALVNFRTYLAMTSIDSPATKRRRSRSWSDESGCWRSDVKVRAGDIADKCLSELALLDGQQVCVLGRYSEARRAIIPPESWFDQTEVIDGDARVGLRYLRHWAILCATLALLLFGVAAGIGSVYLSDRGVAW